MTHQMKESRRSRSGQRKKSRRQGEQLTVRGEERIRRWQAQMERFRPNAVVGAGQERRVVRRVLRTDQEWPCAKESSTLRPTLTVASASASASRPLMFVPTVGQRAIAGVLRRAFLLPRSRSFIFSLHTSYRFQHTKSSQRKPSLRENIYTFPNLLTVSRIAACPALGWSILSDNYSAATCLLLYAGITDWVSVQDSFLSRRPRYDYASLMVSWHGDMERHPSLGPSSILLQTKHSSAPLSSH